MLTRIGSGAVKGASMGVMTGNPWLILAGATAGAAAGGIAGGIENKQRKAAAEAQRKAEQLARNQARDAAARARRAEDNARRSAAVRGPISGDEGVIVDAMGAGGRFDTWHSATYGGTT